MLKKRSLTTTGSGVFSLVLLAACYGVTAVLARYLSKNLGVFEQWYLRYGLGLIFGLLIFANKINYKRLTKIPSRDWQIIIFRSVVGSVIGVAIYTLAAQKTKIGTVAFMQVIPTTALFGILFFGEKPSYKKIALLALSFIGAASVVIETPHDLLNLNYGAILSLISGALFSIVQLARRWQTDYLNNHELTLLTLAMSFLVNYLLSVVIYRRWVVSHHGWNRNFITVLILAGLFSVILNFLINYGFERVGAVLASNILSLEQVFGPLFGFVIYKEHLGAREIIGGGIILVSVLLMNYVSRHELKIDKLVRVPDPVPE